MSLSNTDYDALLVDWLYGELDSTEADRFEKHLETNPDAKAEAMALQQVRVAVQGVIEVEPPDAVTSILMHEASRRSQSAKPGLWASISNFFQPVMMHPAMGAMATLVLVVGVAGALYMRQGGQMVAVTKTDSAAPAPAKRSLQESTGRFERARDFAPSEEEPQGSALEDSEFDDAQEKSYAVDILNADGEGALDGARKFSGKDSKNIKQDQKQNSRAPSSLSRLKGGAKKKLPIAKSEFPSTNALSGADQFAKVGESADDSAAITGLKFGKSATQKLAPKQKPVSWEETQASNFRFAARGKRCKEAGRIANDIRDRRPSYYKSSIAGTAEESDCQYYIAKETTRRSRLASKVAAKSKIKKPATKRAAKKRANKQGKGTSVPPQAVAAPQLDEVSETGEGL